MSLGEMSHSAKCRSAKCRIRRNVVFGEMSLGELSYSAKCRSAKCRIRRNVARRNVVFGEISLGEVSYSAKCRLAKCRSAKCRSPQSHNGDDIKFQTSTMNCIIYFVWILYNITTSHLNLSNNLLIYLTWKCIVQEISSVASQRTEQNNVWNCLLCGTTITSQRTFTICFHNFLT